VALLLPGDNRSVAYMLRVAIAISEPRHALSAFDDIPRADPSAMAEALRNRDGFALISCVPEELAASAVGQSLRLSAGAAALLMRDGDGWKLVDAHAYPATLSPRNGWTEELSPGPFCR
jgi:hypothetical protein